MNDLIDKLRKYPNMLDCRDAALALEQATELLQRVADGDQHVWVDVLQWLNTWDKNEEEE